MGGDSRHRAVGAYSRTDPKGRPADVSKRVSEQNAAEAKRGQTGSDGKGGKPGPTLHLPVRIGGRASLVELDNPAELLEFHWDPTSYDISKEANWDSKQPKGGTEIFNYGGCSATVINFSMFLNDIGQPHKTQRSVEDSIEWLFSRLRPRDEALVESRNRTLNLTPNRRWLSQRDPTAGAIPPILVLFGLRDGFECVLTGCRVRTIFQAPPFLGGDTRPDRASQAVLPAFRIPLRTPTAQDFERVAAGIRAQGGKAILRATIAITLKEYVKAPA